MDCKRGALIGYSDTDAKQAISENITGIDYNNSTGVFSLTSGYVIPTQTELSDKLGVVKTATTYYVNGTTGNDSNDGLSTETAFKTINKATSLVNNKIISATVTINVEPGYYQENVLLTGILQSRISGQNASVLLYGDTVISDNYSCDKVNVTGCIVPITIRGFKSVNGFTVINSLFVTTSFCKVTNYNSQGFLATTGGSLTCQDCESSNNKRGFSAYGAGSYLYLFKNCTGSNNTEYGIEAYNNGLILKGTDNINVTGLLMNDYFGNGGFILPQPYFNRALIGTSVDNGVDILQVNGNTYINAPSDGGIRFNAPTTSGWIQLRFLNQNTVNAKIVNEVGNIQFYTGGESAAHRTMKLTSTQKVLIGTSTDNGVDLLQVNGKAYINIPTSDGGLTVNCSAASGWGRINFSNQGTENAIIVNEVGNIQFYTGGTSSSHKTMKLTSTQKVLIGTSTDNGVDLLQVNGSIKANSYKSNDGSAGISDTFTNADVTIKNGLITAITKKTGANGSFTTNDGKTVTVVNGLITSII